ncbi:hypothetical protein [Streptomyces sp. NPDC050485]|uniref:hypothetical protein n=1 Tax=Streptomyces sp. NPDC050485 TaxID=3365617 RepID=UPI0037AF9E62
MPFVVAAYRGGPKERLTVGTWKYEIWECKTGFTEPHEHDGSCGLWERTAICWDSLWFLAIEKASTLPHAFVQSIYTVNGKTRTIYEHVEGGGLCHGCWERHENTHTKHELDEKTGLCTPCVDVQKRRGPYTRTASGNEFMCEDCRAAFRRVHEQTAYEMGWDANTRLYRPVLDISREDANRD